MPPSSNNIVMLMPSTPINDVGLSVFLAGGGGYVAGGIPIGTLVASNPVVLVVMLAILDLR